MATIESLTLPCTDPRGQVTFTRDSVDSGATIRFTDHTGAAQTIPYSLRNALALGRAIAEGRWQNYSDHLLNR